jgi:hypothetical protein
MSENIKSDDEIIDDVLNFLNRGKNASYTFPGLYLLIPKTRREVIQAKLYECAFTALKIGSLILSHYCWLLKD